MGKKRDLLSGDQALVQSMVGRTIVHAEWIDDPEQADWGEHETALIHLDDGRVIEFGGWGHDAWGATVSLVEP